MKDEGCTRKHKASVKSGKWRRTQISFLRFTLHANTQCDPGCDEWIKEMASSGAVWVGKSLCGCISARALLTIPNMADWCSAKASSFLSTFPFFFFLFFLSRHFTWRSLSRAPEMSFSHELSFKSVGTNARFFHQTDSPQKKRLCGNEVL